MLFSSNQNWRNEFHRGSASVSSLLEQSTEWAFEFEFRDPSQHRLSKVIIILKGGCLLVTVC